MLEDPNNENKECEYDHLQVTFFSVIDNKEFVFQVKDDGLNGKKYCGSSPPSAFLTSGKDVTMEFKSDHSLSHVGYDASYFTVVSQTDSRIQFADSYELEGVISSIGYPDGYNKSMNQV